jgi:hypothetical protein
MGQFDLRMGPGQYVVGVSPADLARKMAPPLIVSLAILEAFGGAVWLFASKALFDLVSYDEYWNFDPGNAQILGLLAVACALTCFAVAFCLWAFRSWLVWALACSLSVTTAVVTIPWSMGGGSGLAAILIIGVDAATLLCLSMRPVRAHFGRPRRV